jgi:tRNA(adenine34) deaminase
MVPMESVDANNLGDDAFMRLALEEAQAAAETGDVPVGAVAVLDGAVIARERNRKEALNDPTAHAELLLLRQVAARLGRWRLSDVTVYCTMEPCAMCAGAMVQARIPRLVYAARDPKAGMSGSLANLVQHPRLNHRVQLTAGVLADAAGEVLRAFFRASRRSGVWSDLPRAATAASGAFILPRPMRTVG